MTATPLRGLAPIRRVTPDSYDLDPNALFVPSHLEDDLSGWGRDSQSVFRTTDGGESWSEVTPPFGAGPNVDCFVITGSEFRGDAAWINYTPVNGCAEGLFGATWFTTDGGRTWNKSQRPGVKMYFDEIMIEFADDRTGWMLFHEHSTSKYWEQSVALLQTDDAGASWTRIEIAPHSIAGRDAGVVRVSDLAVYNDQIALLAARWMAEALVLRTSDGGSRWEPQILPRPRWRTEPYRTCSTASPHIFSAQTAVVFAQCDEEPILYRTDDAGGQWDAYPFPEAYSIASRQDYDHPIVFLSPEIGWALGPTIYKTVDGGRSWNDIKVVGWDGADFWIADEQLAWVVAYERPRLGSGAGASGKYVFLRTVDGMRTWQEMTAKIIP